MSEPKPFVFETGVTMTDSLGRALTLTMVDFQTGEVTCKLFDNVEAALDWRHEVSLAQNPTWHEEHCERCKGLLLKEVGDGDESRCENG